MKAPRLYSGPIRVPCSSEGPWVMVKCAATHLSRDGPPSPTNLARERPPDSIRGAVERRERGRDIESGRPPNIRQDGIDSAG